MANLAIFWVLTVTTPFHLGYVFLIAFIISVGLIYFLLSEVTKILTLPWKILLWCTSVAFLLSYLNIGFSVPGIASRSS